MARFKSIHLNNFKVHKNTKVVFGENTTWITGKNGTGKTSILEAFIWVLTGKDIYGCDPKHYIKDGENRCSVELEHDNFVIFRQMASDKNQTIKIKKSGSNDYIQITQTELYNLLKVDFKIISSIVNTGFFFTMDKKERRDLFRSIVRVESIKDIVSKILGREAPLISNVTYTDVKKDLAVVSSLRLKAEKECASLEGALKEQNILLSSYTLNSSKEKIEEDLKTASEELSAIDNFLREKKNYEITMKSIESSIKKYEEAQKRLSALRKEIEILKRSNISVPNSLLEAKEAIIKNKPVLELEPLPQKPVFYELPPDTCYTCGQKISEKTRAAFAERKRMMWDEYEKRVAEVTQKNIEKQKIESKWKEELENIESEILKWEKKISENMIKIKAAEAEEYRLSSIEKPIIPIEPRSTFLDVSKRDELESKVRQLSSQYQRIIDSEMNIQRCKNRIAEITEALNQSKKNADFYRGVESALKMAPSIEIEIIADRLKVDGLEFELSKDEDGFLSSINYRYNGIPYEYLSAGEKIVVGALVSDKISSLLLKPDGSRMLNIFFIDNIELVSDKHLIDKISGQKIITSVTQGKFEVL